ncbi:MAG: tRNA uridine-5-carboxymethylaminomethyl(34) synthesis GTPase MnmE [Clostridia bacterium]|nr:tRNA uridine-5-carboxymethylaminomethyl(34) synthesis GTPase MnmE [Clostridia bacterium]
MYIDDTIAAISTAQGTGGIGIIRISGSRAFDIASKLFKGKNSFDKIKSHTISYGKLIDPKTGDTVDEVLISKMKGPNTFTREDVVEINCHGGMVVIKKILELVIKQGSRIAEPGEFTKRAFLNGRIDLSQAEAVIDIINSKTDESSRAAVDQLEGKLSRKLREVRSKLIELIAHIEVTVDYPEHDIEEITGQKVYNNALEIKNKLQDIVKGFEKGRIIREGINIVIVGRPNVGKSSLLNELSGKNKAIVTDIPGTTRDIIEEYININGIPVRITDTAGIRETEDIVERIGVERAQKAIDAADLIIIVIDTSMGMDDEDLKILEKAGNKKLIVLLNKIDLVDDFVINEIESRFAGRKVLKSSVKNDIGIDKLEDEISGMFFTGEINANNEILVTNIRHKDLIDKAISSTCEACSAYEAGMPLDCITIDIKNAAEYLGQVTGESISEDVMHEIFKRFCIGK